MSFLLTMGLTAVFAIVLTVWAVTSDKKDKKKNKLTYITVFDCSRRRGYEKN